MKPLAQGTLFEAAPPLPPGMVYETDFITPAEEESLLSHIKALPLTEASYKQYTARRRTVSYGSQYDFGSNELKTAAGIPEFLLPLREKIAAWLSVRADALVHALVTEYRPGTPLGWHRDVPEFEVIAGISLGGWARMRLRPYPPPAKMRRADVLVIDLEPRSAYSMRNEARWGWQHSIPPTPELRYSITFRTMRRGA
jgi:alkylated DNA repair dioxygenase AlkB